MANGNPSADDSGVKMRPYTKEFLEDLRQEEVQMLRDLLSMRPEELKDLKQVIKLAGEIGVEQLEKGAKLAEQVSTLGKFTRWGVVGLMALFTAMVTFAEQIGKIAALIKGGVIK